MNIRLLGAFVGGITALMANTAIAQDFPVRPIQVIVPYSAGGGTDLAARRIADAFQRLNPSARMIVRNQTGGGGSIGTSAAVNARPDGYTLGTGSQGPMALLPHYGGIDYSIDDIEFLGMMGRNPIVAVACAGAPYANAEEFLSYVREHPGEVQIGNPGAGAANHIATAAMAEQADIEVEHVPFGGASQAVTACLGGHIDAMTVTPAEGLPHFESGSLAPLFVMEEDRIAPLPDTPTLIESGVDFTWASHKGIIGPEGMSDDVRQYLVEGFARVFTDPEFISQMDEVGEFVSYRGPEEYEELVRRDSETAAAVIENLGMTGMNQ